MSHSFVYALSLGLHRDGNNAGPSLTRSLGNFIGGALRYYPDDDGQRPLKDLPPQAADVLDTRSAFVVFDGRRGHSVCDFIGSRYSLVYFSISQYNSVPLDQRGPLQDYPDDDTMRALKFTLAPPRGYADGRRQQSIQQAFGFDAKHQALRWLRTDWGKLPVDVLLRIARYAGSPPIAVLSKHALREHAAKKPLLM